MRSYGDMAKISNGAVMVNRRTCIYYTATSNSYPRIDYRPRHNNGSITNLYIRSDNSIRMNQNWKLAVMIAVHQSFPNFCVSHSNEHIPIKLTDHTIWAENVISGAALDILIIIKKNNIFISHAVMARNNLHYNTLFLYLAIFVLNAFSGVMPVRVPAAVLVIIAGVTGVLVSLHNRKAGMKQAGGSGKGAEK